MNISKYLSKAEQLAGARLSGNHALLDDLQNLIDTAEDFLESTASYGGAEIEAARARVASQLNKARAHTRKHRRSQIYRRASDLAQTSGRYVAEHKWQSATALVVAAALIGGIYAGLTLSGQRNRRRW